MFDNLFLWAQIVGFISLCINIISWQLKNSRHIIMCHIPARALMAIQYIMLGAPLGAVMDICSVFRDGGISFMNKKYIPYILGLFLCSVWGVGLLFLQNWYGILPLIGVTILSIGLLQKDNRGLVARAQITCSTLWLFYNALVGSYMGFICGTFIITSAIIGMYRHEKWEIGNCYKSFIPSVTRALFVFPRFRSYS